MIMFVVYCCLLRNHSLVDSDYLILYRLSRKYNLKGCI